MSSEKKLIFTQIPKIMARVGSIAKNRQGTGIQYKFRGIDDVYLALQGLLAEHEVFFTPKVIGQTREERQSKNGGAITYSFITIEFTFYAADGSSFTATTVGEAMDTSDKSTNKAMSTALKYALFQVFCIPTEEPKDTEEHSHEIKARQSTPLLNGDGYTANSKMPEPGDGIISPPTSYQIDFGKWNRRPLEQVYKIHGPEEIIAYIDYLEAEALKKNKPINPNGRVGIFIREAAAFLGAMENDLADIENKNTEFGRYPNG